MQNWMSRNAFKIVFVVFLGFAAIFYHLHRLDTVGREVDDRLLFKPYFAALAAGDYARARDYWTPERRAQFTTEDMARHFAEVRALDGDFIEYRIYNARGGLVDVQVFFKREMFPLTYTLETSADGVPRIAAAGTTKFRGGQTAKPW